MTSFLKHVQHFWCSICSSSSIFALCMTSFLKDVQHFWCSILKTSSLTYIRLYIYIQCIFCECTEKPFNNNFIDMYIFYSLIIKKVEQETWKHNIFYINIILFNLDYNRMNQKLIIIMFVILCAKTFHLPYYKRNKHRIFSLLIIDRLCIGNVANNSCNLLLNMLCFAKSYWSM